MSIILIVLLINILSQAVRLPAPMPSSYGSATPSLAVSEAAAWQYFTYGSGINPTSKLPRGFMGGNWFNFWDLGMALDATIGAYRNGVIGQTDYQARIGALLGFLETMQLNSDGLPFYSYAWDTGARAWNQSWDASDAGRTLNALGFLRRTDQAYANRIDNLLTGKLKPWIEAVATSSRPADGTYARDVRIALQYFSYLNSSYDESAWLDAFYAIWTSTNRLTDVYGNSMPVLNGLNLGPVSYELLEHGPDYARTVTYASDMKSWAETRYQTTGKFGLWGSEFHVKLSDGSTPFAWEFYVSKVPHVGFKTWQVYLANGTELDENDPRVTSTVSSLDAAYALNALFPSDAWLSSIFPAFTQSNLESGYGMYEALFEATNTPDTLVSISHNAVVVLSTDPSCPNAEANATAGSLVALSSLGSVLLNAPSNTVYFIYPDSNKAHPKPPTVGYAQVTDWTALGYVYGAMVNMPQITALDTNSTYVDPTTGAPKISNSIIVLFASGLVNSVVHYYEANGTAPLYWAMSGTWTTGTEYYCTRSGQTAASISIPAVGGGSQDLLLIEMFKDPNRNTVIIFSGFGWKATLASGLYLKTVLASNLSGYTDSWYFWNWQDLNGNSFPDWYEVNQTPLNQGN